MKTKAHILVVDDDRMMAKTLVDILRFKEHDAEAAYSGPEALDKLEKEDFDFLLTDIKMPGMNGVDLVRTIKAIQPDLPAVFMTAYSTDDLMKEGKDLGAITTLKKPVKIDGLLDLLNKIGPV